MPAAAPSITHSLHCPKWEGWRIEKGFLLKSLGIFVQKERWFYMCAKIALFSALPWFMPWPYNFVVSSPSDSALGRGLALANGILIDMTPVEAWNGPVRLSSMSPDLCHPQTFPGWPAGGWDAHGAGSSYSRCLRPAPISQQPLTTRQVLTCPTKVSRDAQTTPGCLQMREP